MEFRDINICGDEIAEYVEPYCIRGIEKNMVRLATGGVRFGGGARFKMYCSDIAREHYNNINFTYELPTADNKFLVFHDLGEMINPSEITRISFNSLKGFLWEITLQATAGKSLVLYFGDKVKYETALSEITAVISQSN